MFLILHHLPLSCKGVIHILVAGGPFILHKAIITATHKTKSIIQVLFNTPAYEHKFKTLLARGR